MAEHTPGPWLCERVDTAVGYAWRVAPIGACLYVDRRGGVVNPGMTDVEAEANAHLIARAPDLLAETARLTEEANRLADALDWIGSAKDAPLWVTELVRKARSGLDVLADEDRRQKEAGV